MLRSVFQSPLESRSVFMWLLVFILFLSPTASISLFLLFYCGCSKAFRSYFGSVQMYMVGACLALGAVLFMLPGFCWLFKLTLLWWMVFKARGRILSALRRISNSDQQILCGMYPNNNDVIKTYICLINSSGALAILWFGLTTLLSVCRKLVR